MASQGTRRERTGSELVFAVLRTLMIGYQLWNTKSCLAVVELARMVQSTDLRLAALLGYMHEEGWVCFDAAAGTVRLSDGGADELLGLRVASLQPETP